MIGRSGVGRCRQRKPTGEVPRYARASTGWRASAHRPASGSSSVHYLSAAALAVEPSPDGWTDLAFNRV